MQKGRLLRVMVALALFALVSIAAAAGWSRLAERRVTAGVSESFVALSQCLLGVHPTGLSNPDKILRAVAIAADLEPHQGSWPARCVTYSDNFRQRVVALHERSFRRCDQNCCTEQSECGLLGRLRAELPSLRAFVDGEADTSLDLALVFKLARKLGYGKHEHVAGVEAAPEPARLLDPAVMTPLFSGDYLRLLTNPGGGRQVLMAFYEHQTRYGLCRADLLGAANARCRQLPASLPVGMAGELLAAGSGAPTLMFAHGSVDGAWNQGLYEVSSGRRLLQVAARPAGAFVWPDGTHARVSREPPLTEPALYRVANQEVERPVLIGAKDPTMGPMMVWDEVIWTEAAAAGRHQVFARRVYSKGAALGHVRRLGETVSMSARPTFDSCRTPEALVFLLRPVGGSRATLLFRTKRGWAAPLQVKTGRTFGFTCQGEIATLSRISGREELSSEPFEVDQGPEPVTGRYTVGRMRCMASGCEIGRATLSLRRYSPRSRYLAGDLGNAMVVMWRSPMGDVRMRVAPLEYLSAARDVSVFDDVEHEGFGWDLERDPIIGRSGKVLVLISRQLGTSSSSSTYAFRIDESGRFAPVTVR